MSVAVGDDLTGISLDIGERVGRKAQIELVEHAAQDNTVVWTEGAGGRDKAAVGNAYAYLHPRVSSYRLNMGAV